MKAQVQANSGREFRTHYKVAVRCLPPCVGGGYGLFYLELAVEVEGGEQAGDMKTGGVGPPARALATMSGIIVGMGARGRWPVGRLPSGSPGAPSSVVGGA
ncbi:MAG: hypothetical protein CMJ98_08550 [Planctomycetes bacterium]|nr:hypothetical protein [Planctomycetota bacterium]